MNDEIGVFHPDYEKQLAQSNIFYSNRIGEQAGIVAANRTRAQKTGIPYSIWSDADNRDIHTDQNLDGLNPKFIRMMAGEPGRISYFKDQLPLWNDVVTALEALPAQKPMPKPEPPQSGIPSLSQIRSVNDIEELLFAPGTTSTKDRRQPELSRMAQEKYESDVEKVSQETDKLVRVNALMNDFYRLVPGDWRKLDDAELLRLIHGVGQRRNVNTSDLSVSDFREKGDLTSLDFSGVKFSELYNVFGAVDMYKAAQRLFRPELRPENLVDVNKDSTLDLQVAKLQMLQDENEMLRGLSFGSETMTSLLQSVRLVAEIGATGGFDTILKSGAWLKAWRNQGLSGVSKLLGASAKEIGMSTLKRMPFYAGQSVAESYNKNFLGGSATVFDENDIQIKVPDKEARDFVEGFITYMFEHSKEIATEQMGELLPFNDLLERGLGKILGLTATKSVRNSFLSKLGMHPMTRRLTFDMLRKYGVNGTFGEISEEYLGNAASFLYTTIAEHYGMKPENTPGTENFLMRGREAKVTWASILLQQALFGMGISALNSAAGYRVGPFHAIEDHDRAMREFKIMDYVTDKLSNADVARSSAEELEVVLDKHFGYADINIPVDNAEDILLQATKDKTGVEAEEAREMLKKMGITQELIAAAREKGVDLVLSRNTIMSIVAHGQFKNAKDAMHQILDNAVSVEFGKTDGEIRADSFTTDELKKMDDLAKENNEFWKEADKILPDALAKAEAVAKEKAKANGEEEFKVDGKLKRSFDSFKWIFRATCTYLWSETSDEGKTVLLDMLKKLSIRFAQNPDSFDAAAEWGSLNQIVGTLGLENMYGEEEANRRIAEAEAMEKTKDNPAKIWAKTGLQRGVDGKWRAEIPDIAFSTEDSARFESDLFAFMDWYSDIVNNTWSISELVDAPELFEAYPQLKNLKVEFVDLGGEGLRGMHRVGENRIYLNSNTFNGAKLADKMERAASASEVDEELKKEIAINAADMLSTLAHELQHVIQDKEGFARGSSPEEMERDRYAINSIDGKLKKLMEKGNKIRSEHSKKGKAFRDAFKEAGYKVEEGGKYTEYGEALFETEKAVSLLEKLKKENSKSKKKIVKALENFIEVSKKMDEFHEESTKLQEDYYGRYRRVAGEVEARNVQARMRKAFLERLGIPLSETEDEAIPRDEQIVLHQGPNKISSINVPTEDQKAFEKAIDDFANGTLDARRPVTLTKHTPPVLLSLRLKGKHSRVADRPITITQKTIRKAIGEIASTSTGEFHDVDLQTLKQIPDAIYHPVMVLESNDGESLEIHTSLVDKSKRPVFVVLRLNFQSDIQSKKGGSYVVNSIRSIYGIDNANTPINRLEAGHGRYVHVQKLNAWVHAAGANTPRAGALNASNGYTIIEDSGNSSANPKNSQNSLPQEGGSVHGAIYGVSNVAKFTESHAAIIALFGSANASTLPHESAHWLLTAMRSLVAEGLGTEKMEKDLQTIDDWLAKQDYSEEAAREQGFLRKNADGTEYVDVETGKQEYFARAFEMYLREGKFPEKATSKLKTALHNLMRMLRGIYMDAKELNVQMDDSITEFFDGLFVADYVMQETSTLTAILREINAGALSMSKAKLAELEKTVREAKDDAVAEAYLAALNAYRKGIREQQSTWREEAKRAYAESKAEKAFTYIRKGHKFSEDFLRNALKLDEKTIEILRKKGLTVRGTKASAAPTTEAPAESPAEAPANDIYAVSEEAKKNAVELDGTEEQFSDLPENAVIKLPEGQEEIDRVLAALSYGTDYEKQTSPLLKRIKDVLSAIDPADAMYKIYTAAKALFDKNGGYARKVDLVRYVARAASNLNKSAIKEKNNPSKLSLNQTYDDSGNEIIQNFEGQKASQADYTWDEIVKAFEEVSKDWDSEEDRKLAKLVVEHTKADDIVTDTQIFEEYKANGGTLQKPAADKHLKKVRDEIKSRMESRGFFYQEGKAVDVPANILETMNALGYDDVNALITDLLSAKGRSRFISDYMKQRHAQYREAFLDAPEWNTETGATKYLDAILRALKLTEGMKFSERVRLARMEAVKQLRADNNVGQIMRGVQSVEKSLQSSMSRLLKVLKSTKQEDKAAAITAALDMHKNAARLQAVREIQARVNRIMRNARRMGRAKAGSTIDGDALNAIKALNRHFLLSSARPNWTHGENDPTTPYDVIAELVRRRTDDMYFESDEKREDYIAESTWGVLEQWSDWMRGVLVLPSPEVLTKADVEDIGELSMDQLEELGNVLDWIYEESRDMMDSVKGSWAEKRNAIMGEVLDGMDKNKRGDYVEYDDPNMWEKVKRNARKGLHIGKSLLWMAHMVDGFSEFYGKHVIGPFRKYIELELSAGEADTMFWRQKIEGEAKPHMEALMRSCKDRNLSAPIKNKNTLKHGYQQLQGKTMAFVLLNAGTEKNRQRLMASFGWSEDELNSILSKFTKEDFEHAEAIWASLKTLGNEVGKVFLKERHYRMKWEEGAPIHLTLEDGTEIMSEGGYYPLAYKYAGTKGNEDFDIMNNPANPKGPTRPGATKDRAEKLEEVCILMSPAVLSKHIDETSRYIGMWEPLRMANAIWNDTRFRNAFIENYSREAYDVFRKLVEHVNNPGKGFKYGKFANQLASIMATTALGFKATTMEKQWASLLIGIDRLEKEGGETAKGYFTEAFFEFWQNPREFRRKWSNESPFLRDRFNLKDRDLRIVDTEFKKPLEKTADVYRYWAFYGLKQMDLCVAAIQWSAAYNYAYQEKGLTERQASAYADDFVAASQGAARTIDIPAIQLDALGRAITPFFGPACAAFNTRVAGFSVIGKMTPEQRVTFAVDNLAVPALMCAFIMATANGLLFADDDDDWGRVRKAFLRNLLSEPISGFPIVQDLADASVNAIVNGNFNGRQIFDVAMLRPLEDITQDTVKAFSNLDNPDYALYLGTSVAGEVLNMPVVQVYEEYEKLLMRNGFWPSDEKLETTLKNN